MLRPHPKEVSKVVSGFPLKPIHTCTCFLSEHPCRSESKATPHLLHVSRALVCYPDRAKSFWLFSYLFIAISGASKDQVVSSRKLSKLIMQWISVCYQMADIPVPPNVTDHSTRVQAAFSACFGHAPYLKFQIPSLGVLPIQDSAP